MNPHIKSLTAKLQKNIGAPEETISMFQTAFGKKVPEDYIEFMRETNGAEGTVGDSYIQIWPVENILSLNKEYRSDEFTPGLLIFASDGGDTAYAFDARSTEVNIAEFPFVSIDSEDIRKRANNFTEFLEYLASK
jgi:hypothetical protein